MKTARENRIPRECAFADLHGRHASSPLTTVGATGRIIFRSTLGLIGQALCLAASLQASKKMSLCFPKLYQCPGGVSGVACARSQQGSAIIHFSTYITSFTARTTRGMLGKLASMSGTLKGRGVSAWLMRTTGASK
jgi:hypothetical protein